MTELSEKVVVITGASTGIGAAAAKLLTSRGMSVVLVARTRETLEAVAAECGRNALAVVGDMSEREAVRGVVDKALARFGHIDVWINNVGRGISRPPSELTDEDIDEVMRTNVKSALYGVQEVLPHFKSRNSGQVINISSMLGRMPLAVIRSAYCGSKHFLNALTAVLRDEIRQTHPGIQISLVSPGVVRTEFGLRALHGGPDNRQMPYSQSAEEVAEVIAWAIETRPADAYTRPGARERVASYYADLAVDPPETLPL
jgi:NADP-dependent 3-hydroxy acid dehydrogenase YdfG